MTSNSGIPKIIHQIWIGPNPKPTLWIKTIEDFCKNYQYQHILWTESNIETMEWNKFPGLRDVYDTTEELNGKSDVLRYLALYSQGGIYIDADSVIIKPQKFADFLETNKAHIFAAFEEFNEHTKTKPNLPDTDFTDGNKFVAPGVIGATARHPFIESACKEIVENANKEKGKGAWMTVGPVFFTRHYNRYKDKYNDITIYPMKYFYPIHWQNITDPELHTKINIPEESMLFQYGYNTNNFAKIFKERNMQKGGSVNKRKITKRIKQKTHRKIRSYSKKQKKRQRGGNNTIELVPLEKYKARTDISNGTHANNVPLVLYQTWHSEKVKPGMKKAVEDVRAMNPEIDCHLYNDEDCEKFIKEAFGDRVFNAFRCLKPGAFKADLWRYCILYEKGGIYMDIKFIPKKKLIDIIKENPKFFVHDQFDNHCFWNGFIISPPKNQIFKDCIDKIVENVETKSYQNDCLEVTGPCLLGPIVKKHIADYVPKYAFSQDRKYGPNDAIINKETKEILLEQYPGYRDEQKQGSKTAHYSNMWFSKDIFSC